MASENHEIAKDLTVAMIPALDLPEDADTAAVQVAHLYWTMLDALEMLHSHEAVPSHLPKVKRS